APSPPPPAAPHVEHGPRGTGRELRSVHRLHLRWTHPEPAGGRGAHAIAARVLAGGQPFQEEVLAAVADLLVEAQARLPLEPGDEGDGLEAGAARVAEVHVL